MNWTHAKVAPASREDMFMRSILLFAAALVAAPAFAEELVASNGSDSIRLSDGPCRNEQVLKQLEPKFQDRFRAATANLKGQTFAACWHPLGSAALLLYEDGDQGLIPMADLKHETRA
jgi:hypothetical protein